MSINTTVNRNRIPKETKEILQELFPYNRRINKDTTANTVEDAINEISNNLYTKRWIPIVPDKYIEEGIPNGGRMNILPSDLKVKLANVIIDNERLKNANN